MMMRDRTILILDDSAEDREAYRRFLQRDPYGSYQFLEAESAEAALELLQTTTCDLILLDFCLPGLNGLEFLEVFKRQQGQMTDHAADRHLSPVFQANSPVPNSNNGNGDSNGNGNGDGNGDGSTAQDRLDPRFTSSLNGKVETLKGASPSAMLPPSTATHTAIVMLTGYGAESIAVEAMKWGVQDYLVKNHLKPDVLQLAVRHVLQQSSLQVQLSQVRERQRLIATTSLRIRQSLNLEEILNTAVAEVQQILRCEQVAIYQLSPQDLPDALTLETCDTLTHHCVWQDANRVFDGEMRAIATFSRTIDASGMQAAEGLASSQSNLVAAIHLGDPQTDARKPWGLVVAYQADPQRQWTAEETEILQEVSVQLAIAIQQAELLSQTQTALQREKELNTFKSQIIATVSHEYRTPLTAIWAAASTLRLHHENLTFARQLRCLEIIEQKTKHLTQLIDDMLTVHECEINQTRFKPTPLDLAQFLTTIVQEQRDNAGEAYQVIFVIRSACKGFYGDPGLLRLIFANIISNAIKYSPDGGEVRVQLSSRKSDVILSVEDQGIGIPKDDQAALFQKFRRASNVDSIPGTGLGLVITRSCVELHGGSITLQSRPHKGTKVTITLPKVPKESHQL
jgi:signal transduction histidine kinase/CheY-like chemotaxis protein